MVDTAMALKLKYGKASVVCPSDNYLELRAAFSFHDTNAHYVLVSVVSSFAVHHLTVSASGYHLT